MHLLIGLPTAATSASACARARQGVAGSSALATYGCPRRVCPQPFTAPMRMPSTKWRWKARNTRIIGIAATAAPVISIP